MPEEQFEEEYGDDLETLPGVGPATADSLMEAGFETFMQVAATSPSELADVDSVGENTAKDAVAAAKEKADVGNFDSGKERLEDARNRGSLSIGVPVFDEMFNEGGMPTGEFFEFYGQFGSGKSQVVHQALVTVQLPKEVGGLGKSGLLIDTEDCFRAFRFVEMVKGLTREQLSAVIERDGYDFTADDVKESNIDERSEGTPAHDVAEDFLQRTRVSKAFNANHQMLLAEQAEELARDMQDSEFPLGLVCVDSLMAHFRAEYVGRGNLANRQQKLNQHLGDLDDVADLHDCLVIYTNQVSADPDSYFGDPTQPIGGNIVGHKSDYRVYIKNSKKNKRIFSLVDAPELADQEVVARITEDGIVPE